MKVWYNNVNGYTSKKGSVERIIQSIDPDVIALCETKKCAGISEDEFVGYELVESPMALGKEGFIFGVRKGYLKQ